MLNWLRFKAWQGTVSNEFQQRYGANLLLLARDTVGPDLAKMIFEKVAEDFYSDTTLAGEQVARILEQANGVPVNQILQDVQFQLTKDGKWEGEFKRVPYR